jgi:uncharacterized membrane protein
MRFPWFKLAGFLYIPVKGAGWVCFILALVYTIYSFIQIDGKSHSVSDTLMNFFFRVFLIFAGYTIIAFLTSLKRENE